MVGAGLVLFWVAVALFASISVRAERHALPFRNRARPATLASCPAVWLGTDHPGRDILSRLIWGRAPCSPRAGDALRLPQAASGLALSPWGRVDDVLSSVADHPVVPRPVLYIIIIATFGALINIIFAITFVSGSQVMRIVRGLTSISGAAGVAAAETRGQCGWIMPSRSCRTPAGRSSSTSPPARLTRSPSGSSPPRPAPPPIPQRADQRSPLDAMSFPHMTIFPHAICADPRLQLWPAVARDLPAGLTATR
jgi:hypothetical protein